MAFRPAGLRTQPRVVEKDAEIKRSWSSDLGQAIPLLDHHVVADQV